MFNSLIGVGLREPHYNDFLFSKPEVGWVEVRSENYLSCGGVSFDNLLKIRESYPVSLHGVGMSLGSSDGLDFDYLKQLKKLIDIIDPCFVSDHLSWSSIKNHFLPDLLPSPYNDESLQIFVNNISRAQEFLGRELIIENPSTCLEYNNSTYREEEFLNILASRSGAGILLDLNNIYVSSYNNGWSALEYLQNIKPNKVKEIHLAGHSENIISQNKKLLIDTHNNIVCPEVWDLYHKSLLLLGTIPTLIEWDSDIPEFEILLNEVKKADLFLQEIETYAYVFELSTIQDKILKSIISVKMADLDFIKSTGNITAKERLLTHRHAILENFVNSLKISYPGIWKLIGEECGRSIALAYSHKLSNITSRSGINNFGNKFPEYLKEFPSTASLAYLPDFAKLELLKGLSADAKNDTPVSDVDLASLNLDNLEEYRLVFNSSVFFMMSDFPLNEIQEILNNEANQDSSPINLSAEPSYIVVHRTDHIVHTTWLKKPDWQCLLALANGKTFKIALRKSKEIQSEINLEEIFKFILLRKMLTKIYK